MSIMNPIINPICQIKYQKETFIGKRKAKVDF